MAQPYRIVDLNAFSGIPSGAELAETSVGGSGSFQLPLAVLSSGRVAHNVTSSSFTVTATTYGDILVNFNGAVTINLPAASTRIGVGLTVADVGGFAATNNITILPNGAEKIAGKSSLVISVNFGSYTLCPIATGGWYVVPQASDLAVVVDIKLNYGAAGDGVTDDTTAFNNALNSGYPNIYLPTGTYLMGSSPVSIPNSVRRIFGPGTIHYTGATGQPITFSSYSGDGCVVTLTFQVDSSSANTIVILETTANIHIDQCWFKNGGQYCLDILTATTATMTNISFTNNRVDAYATSCINSDTNSSTINFLIADNNITASSSTSDIMRIGSNGAATHAGLQVINNIATAIGASAGFGIIAYNAQNARIDNNNVKSRVDCIHIVGSGGQTASNWVISNNFATSTTDLCIACDANANSFCKDGLIVGNSGIGLGTTSSVNMGIFVNDNGQVNDIAVIGNKMYNVQGATTAQGFLSNQQTGVGGSITNCRVVGNDIYADNGHMTWGISDDSHCSNFFYANNSIQGFSSLPYNLTGTSPVVDVTWKDSPVTATNDYTVTPPDRSIINNKVGSTMTVTMPSASIYVGRVLVFTNYQAQTVVSASSNVVPITGGAAGTAILAATAGKWARIVSNGTNWVILEAN